MKRFNRSVGFALDGIRSCFRREPNFKIHIAFTALAIAAGIFFSINNMEWLVIIICIGAVLAAELINTAVEEICNLVHEAEHPAVKLIKDVSAAAVLVIAIASAACGAFIFIPKIISLINY